MWIFVRDHIQVGVISNTEQQLSLQLTMKDGKKDGDYSGLCKCSSLERLSLWDYLYSIRTI